MSRSEVDVLVVGAGPAGLSLALQAHDLGARVRVVERRPDAFRPSRALMMHPRTLEMLKPLGVTPALLAAADVAPTVHAHLGSRTVQLDVAEVGLPDTGFPHLLLIRQAAVESVLSAALAARGVTVERGTALLSLRQREDTVTATVRHRGELREVVCRHLAGCDGADSTVRSLLAVGWKGAMYRQSVLLADVELESGLTPGVAHLVAAPGGVLFLFALGETATWRLMATRDADRSRRRAGRAAPDITRTELQELIDRAALAAAVTDVGFATEVRIQHRIASAFQVGRCFLVGDAAHAHSPAGGQGMNTSIQDALNLGWKLAFAVPGIPTDGPLLKSYEQERRPVARRVLALTHLLFWGEAGTDRVAGAVRTRAAPLAAPAVPCLVHTPAGQVAARALSQFWVHYRGSPLSLSDDPRSRQRPRVGERMPDALVISDRRPVRLHDLMARPGVHVLLQRDAAILEPTAFGPWVHVERVTSWPGRGVVIVRPDGYVGYRSGTADPAGVRHWLDHVSARGGAEPP